MSGWDSPLRFKSSETQIGHPENLYASAQLALSKDLGQLLSLEIPAQSSRFGGKCWGPWQTEWSFVVKFSVVARTDEDLLAFIGSRPGRAGKDGDFDCKILHAPYLGGPHNASLDVPIPKAEDPLTVFQAMHPGSYVFLLVSGLV